MDGLSYEDGSKEVVCCVGDESRIHCRGGSLVPYHPQMISRKMR